MLFTGKAQNATGFLSAGSHLQWGGEQERKTVKMFLSCEKPKHVNTTLQTRWKNQELTYKYQFNLCFFPLRLVVFILPNMSGYFDSFLKQVVSCYPNREICIKGVCYNQFQKNSFKQARKWRLKTKTTTPKMGPNPRSNPKGTSGLPLHGFVWVWVVLFGLVWFCIILP